MCRDLSQRARNFLGNSQLLWRIPKISGIAVIKSILIAYHKFRHNRSGITSNMFNADVTLNVVRLWQKEEVASSG